MLIKYVMFAYTGMYSKETFLYHLLKYFHIFPLLWDLTGQVKIDN